MTPCATARIVAVASLHEPGCALRAREAWRKWLRRLLAPDCAVRHHDAGDDERGEEHQDGDADARDEPEGAPGEIADLRLHRLYELRQVRVCLHPGAVNLLADDRPLLDARTGCRHLQRVGLHAMHEILDRVAERAHQHRRRCDDHDQAGDHDQRRGESLPAAHATGQHLLERIQGDCEDQGPDHQDEERRENPVASITSAGMTPRGSGPRAGVRRPPVPACVRVSWARSSGFSCIAAAAALYAPARGSVQYGFLWGEPGVSRRVVEQVGATGKHSVVALHRKRDCAGRRRPRGNDGRPFQRRARRSLYRSRNCWIMYRTIDVSMTVATTSMAVSSVCLAALCIDEMQRLVARLRTVFAVAADRGGTRRVASVARRRSRGRRLGRRPVNRMQAACTVEMPGVRREGAGRHCGKYGCG